MTNQTKLRPDLTTFSVSSLELALFAGLWLEKQGLQLCGNLTAEVHNASSNKENFTNAGCWHIEVRGYSVEWLDKERDTNHFVSALDLINWLLDTPKLPVIGEYQPTISANGLQVGCTKVSFETFDELAKEVGKFRAKLSAAKLTRRKLTSHALSTMTDFSNVRAELKDFGTYTMTEQGGRYAFISDYNKTTTLNSWHHSKKECCLSAMECDETTLYIEDEKVSPSEPEGVRSR